MTEKTDVVLKDLAMKAFKALLPFALGWLVSVYTTQTNDHTQIQILTGQVTELQSDVKQVKENYATNKRVDDLAAEVRTGLSSLGGKVDQIIKLLIERR